MKELQLNKRKGLNCKRRDEVFSLAYHGRPWRGERKRGINGDIWKRRYLWRGRYFGKGWNFGNWKSCGLGRKEGIKEKEKGKEITKEKIFSWKRI